MTIACCYVVPEGIVLGSDSTITTEVAGKCHFLNHNQKIFEVGNDSQFGILTWGLASFDDVSYRTLIARLADQFESDYPKSALDAANAWSGLAWEAYKKAFSNEIDRFRKLERLKSERDEGTTSRPTKASKAEDEELSSLFNTLRAGFCLAGYSKHDRMPHAYSMELNPQMRSQPFPSEIQLKHFGKDEIVSRIIGLFDEDIKTAIEKSTFWTGDRVDLDNILSNMKLERPDVTIRDAIDFVHFTIYSTIKATKFSTRDNDCGGPIELAVITTDRNFRWVRHKTWDSAIDDWNP